MKTVKLINNVVQVRGLPTASRQAIVRANMDASNEGLARFFGVSKWRIRQDKHVILEQQRAEHRRLSKLSLEELRKLGGRGDGKRGVIT